MPIRLLSSQVSPRERSTIPLPHVSSLRQSELHASPSSVLLSSLSSPASSSTIPLPHVSSLAQSALQPSPPIRLPSSHTSPGSMRPSPHLAPSLPMPLGSGRSHAPSISANVTTQAVRSAPIGGHANSRL